MEKRKYCIYYHMSPDKRYYIGQTCQDLENRWKNGAGYKSKKFNIDIINSLGGWQSFEHGILEDNIDLENIDEREAYYINLFNSVDNGFNTYRENYNGYHFSDLWTNEEIKEKIILKLKEQRNTKEYKENQSRLMSEKWKDDEYRKKQNDSWTEERRNKLSEKTKECWNDDEYRNKISTFQSEYKKELWKDADYRKKNVYLCKMYRDRRGF